jgi:hypothetical protein
MAHSVKKSRNVKVFKALRDFLFCYFFGIDDAKVCKSMQKNAKKVAKKWLKIMRGFY